MHTCPETKQGVEIQVNFQDVKLLIFPVLFNLLYYFYVSFVKLVVQAVKWIAMKFGIGNYRMNLS